jgi:Xaa-Pro dipeptidase
MKTRQLDVLVAFHPASVSYLTGFFTFGYLLLNFAVIPAEGEPIIVCRDNEEYWIKRTAAFDGHIFWEDGEDTDPAGVAIRALESQGAAAARIGLETAFPYDVRLDAGLRAGLPKADLVDLGDDVISRIREIKSPAELDYMRSASRAGEAGMAAGVAAARAGVSERDLAAAVSSALVMAGSDVAGPGPIASGPRAAHIHASYEDRTLERGDTINIEVDGCVRYYYSRFFRTIKVGTATPEEEALARRMLALQDRAYAEVTDGAHVGVADKIIRDGIHAEGVKHYTNNSLYSIGFALAPAARTLAVVPTSDWRFEAGMAFHSYVKVGAFFFSETIAVTKDGYERLTNYPRELIVTPA